MTLLIVGTLSSSTLVISENELRLAGEDRVYVVDRRRLTDSSPNIRRLARNLFRMHSSVFSCSPWTTDGIISKYCLEDLGFVSQLEDVLVLDRVPLLCTHVIDLLMDDRIFSVRSS